MIFRKHGVGYPEESDTRGSTVGDTRNRHILYVVYLLVPTEFIQINQACESGQC